jgi:tetratricopeptide (TPR) repeat protein
MKDGKIPPELESIAFISLPEGLDTRIGDFEINPGVLIPVELLPGEDEWDARELSWEMIIAAMLKILVYDSDHEQAAYYRDFVLAAKPSIVDDLSESGIAKAQSRDFEVAEEIFKALICLNDTDINSLLNLALVYDEHAEVYEQAGRSNLTEEYRDLAFDVYRKALSASPANEHVQFNAAHFYLKMKNFQKAREHFNAFLALSTDRRKKDAVSKVLAEIMSQDEMDVLFNEAYDFIRLGNEREGIEKISSFISKNPNVWNAWFLLGWAHRRLSEYDEGKIAFEKALEIGPEQSDTLNELAICLLELEEFTQCRTTLAKALAIEPENVKIISNLGILSLKEKKVNEAKDHFKSVLMLNPDDPIAKNYLEYISAESQQT